MLMAIERYGDFEWDKAKARSNLRKHGVSFEEALTAFADPQAIDAPDLYLPDRSVLIGFSRRARLLFIVHTERGARIRLIRARKASPGQRKKYEEGLS